MGEVVSIAAIFCPSKWLADWESFGGIVALGEGPFGDGGKRQIGMGEWMPCSDRASPAERFKIDALRYQVRNYEARLRVINFVTRRAATRGY